MTSLGRRTILIPALAGALLLAACSPPSDGGAPPAVDAPAPAVSPAAPVPSTTVPTTTPPPSGPPTFGPPTTTTAPPTTVPTTVAPATVPPATAPPTTRPPTTLPPTTAPPTTAPPTTAPPTTVPPTTAPSTTTTTRPPTTTTTAPPTQRLAGEPEVGVQFHGTWTSYSANDRDVILDKMVAAGMDWVRVDLGWASFEYAGPQPYPWYVQIVDEVIADARAHGLKVLATVWGSPSWANGGRDPRFPPTDPQQYARFARWVSERYATSVDAWEVWNEPNLDDFWAGASPAAYATLLRAAYPAFKAGDPGSPVLLGGPSYNDTTYLAALYANGIAGSFDIMSTHPYMGPADLPPETPDDGNMWTIAHVQAVRSLMAQYGDGAKKIWFTEFGWSAHANNGSEAPWHRGVTNAQQGDYFVRTLRWLAANAPYVTKVFWYNERDQQSGSTHLDGYGILRLDLSAKPAYATISSYLNS